MRTEDPQGLRGFLRWDLHFLGGVSHFRDESRGGGSSFPLSQLSFPALAEQGQRTSCQLAFPPPNLENFRRIGVGRL